MISSAEREAKAAEIHSRAIAAKELLIAQILEEARREGIALSDYERGLLDFSGDMLRAETFDPHFDYDGYEKKIAGLVSDALRRARQTCWEGEERFRQAAIDIQKEDGYLARMAWHGVRKVRPRGEWLVQTVVWSILIGFTVAWFFLYKYFESRGLAYKWPVQLLLLVPYVPLFAVARSVRRVLRRRMIALGLKQSN